MKNRIQKATVILGVVLIAFTACRKDNIQNIVTGNDETEALATQAQTDMSNAAVYTDEGATGILMDNEGIAADFLVDETDMDVVQGPGGGGADDSLKNRIRENSFIRCLQGIHLTDSQKVAIRHDLKSYNQCKETAVKRAREIYEDLQKAYKTKAAEILKAYKDGRITKEQMEKYLKVLRENFRKELRSKHLDEKLDEAMKHCLREFYGNLKNILTERQWKAFVACHKH